MKHLRRDIHYSMDIDLLHMGRSIMHNLSTLPQASAACEPAGVTDQQGKDAFEVRFGTATAEATKTGSVQHTLNGDETLGDHSGTYTKCLKQAGYGVVDPGAFTKFQAALASGNPADFEAAGLLGGQRKLNGPLGAFALTLTGADSQCFGDDVVPTPPSVQSKEYATELVELYWASLLRDVPFTEYESNATAQAAANELTALKHWYKGPLHSGKVTPRLLFRGGFHGAHAGYFAGENFSPDISQLCIRPTNLGSTADRPEDAIIRRRCGLHDRSGGVAERAERRSDANNDCSDSARSGAALHV